MKNRAGFTLLEMSIILVIIAALISGVVVARKMIVVATDRGVIKEATMYKQAVQSFAIKYGQLPGDMTNPGSYWSSVTWPGGNGDGNIDWNTEGPEAWLQLDMASLLVAGGMSRGPSFSTDGQPGINIPLSGILAGAGWTLGTNEISDNNMLLIGKPATGGIASAPALTGEQAYDVDGKLDDGAPLTGNVRVEYLLSPAPTTCYDGGTERYNLNETVMCSINIAIGQ